MLNRTGAVIYVGNLPDDIRERELDDLFYKVRQGRWRRFGMLTRRRTHLPAMPPPSPYGPPRRPSGCRSGSPGYMMQQQDGSFACFHLHMQAFRGGSGRAS